MTPHTVIEIKDGLQKAADALQHYCATLTEDTFFHQPTGKWSPAQQVKHLIVSANMSRLAFSLPKFIVRMIAGKSNRPSRTYDELVAKYTLKLSQGGRASGRFVPKPIPATVGKEKLLQQLNNAMDRFTAAVSKHDKEPVLDLYLAPHPLLGKITLRELGFFTIHHTYHHLASIQAMTAK